MGAPRAGLGLVVAAIALGLAWLYSARGGPSSPGQQLWRYSSHPTYGFGREQTCG